MSIPVWHDVVGIAGVIGVLLAYLLLQLRRIDPARLPYSLLNALGASLILVSLSVDFNLSAVLMEAFWVLISIIGIVRAVRERRSGAAGATPAPRD